MDITLRILFIGAGATLLMDAWALVLRRFGVRSLDFALLGRWIGHWFHGRWRHARIADAAPIRGERVLGWAAHYTIGVSFAGLLVAIFGPGWTQAPSLGPALAVGLGTAVAPLFILQPALGGATPAARLKSLVTHTVYGVGLYLAALASAALT